MLQVPGFSMNGFSIPDYILGRKRERIFAVIDESGVLRLSS